MKNARENVDFDIGLARRYGTIGGNHVCGRRMILIAPKDAERLGESFNLVDVADQFACRGRKRRRQTRAASGPIMA